MSKLDRVILGINHMFLNVESMTDGNVHTNTLRSLANDPNMDALDCWVWASHAKEEIEILKNCGKQINYNIGDRYGEVPVFPATKDAGEKAYALDTLRRETEFAMECGAKKIIFASGRDVPEERTEAGKRLVDFVLEWSRYIPEDVWLTLEPTDRDVDKCFLYGDLQETCDAVEKIRQGGKKKIGILLDMGHVPIMHETLESAVEKSADYIEHIHLGNAVVKNPSSPFYGDKHPCWGEADGEYTQQDGTRMIQLLKHAGYFSKGCPQTVSFEMRPLAGLSAEETVKYLKQWFEGVYRNL